MKTVVFYKLAENKTREDVLSVYPRHSAKVETFIKEGRILSIGTLAHPSSDGISSMGIFKTRGDAEEFVAVDPFRLEGVVGSFDLIDYHDLID